MYAKLNYIEGARPGVKRKPKDTIIKSYLARSYSASHDNVGQKVKYNERHSREKIENFLTEYGMDFPSKRGDVKKAWEEYSWLMKSEKALAYKYPKQFFESLKNPECRRKYMMRLDQSPLSKLISSSQSSKWKEGAQIQLESLQASEQQLVYLQSNAAVAPEFPGDSDLDLYPEGCDDFHKQSILHLFEVTKNEVLACHKREYVKLVCKEASLKQDFPKEYEANIKQIPEVADLENYDLNNYRKIQNKGPLYEFIISHTKGNTEVIGKLSLHEYYILSTAEAVLRECDPNSEWTYRYPEDIQQSVRSQPENIQQSVRSQPENQQSTRNHPENFQQSVRSQPENFQQSMRSQPENFQQSVRSQPEKSPNPQIRQDIGSPLHKSVLNRQYRLDIQDNVNKAGTYPAPKKTEDTEPMEVDSISFLRSKDKVSPQRQNNHPEHLLRQHTHPVYQGHKNEPSSKGRLLERQNSHPSSEAFGTLPDPGDPRVRDWKGAYSDLHKSWTFQASQVEELTNRLSSFASKQLTEGNAAFADLSDKNRPTKIGERFGLIYDDEWSEVFDELSDKGLDEETIILKLQQTIQYGYDFCFKKAEEQLHDLEQVMKVPILQPFQTKHTLHVPKDMVKILTSATLKHAKEYRKVTASISSPEVCKVFFKEESDFLERTFQKCAFGQKLRAYVEACVEQMWLMCVQDPQMTIDIAVPGTPVDKDLFKFYNKKGRTVHLTVWPVVYLHKGGPLVSKGYVLPA